MTLLEALLALSLAVAAPPGAPGAPVESALQQALPWATQGQDGTWAAPEGGARLATTAAMLWALAGEGHSPTRGSEAGRAARALRWIADHAFRRGPDGPMDPGEALAALVVEDLAWCDPTPTTWAAALRARARLIETQREDGTWAVAGRAPGSPRALEATGWAVLALRAGATEEPDGVAAAAAERGARALAAAEQPVAEAFSLLLDVRAGESAADVAPRFDALFRGARGDHRTPVLDLLATATAFRAGGDLWRSWSRAEWRALCAAQLREGPRKGQWPAAGDPRGTTWELALRLQTLAIGFRYDRTALTRG